MQLKVKNYLDLTLFYTKAYLLTEFRKNYLGIFWVFIEPACYFGIYYLVFGFFLGGREEGFAEYLMTGIASWHWFNKSLLSCSSSIYSAGKIIKKVNINKLVFPVAKSLSDGFKGLVMFTVLTVFLMMIKGQGVNFLLLVIIFLLNFIFILSLNLVVSLLVPFLPDLRSLMPILTMGMMFCSAIFYYIAVVPEKYRIFLYLNPMYHIITTWRSVYNQGDIELFVIGVIALFSMMLIVLSILLERKLSKVLPLYVL